MMAMTDAAFQEIVWSHYAEQGRDLPWRQPGAEGRFDPYKIMVSELMLQQTQVSRVIEKYRSFLKRFPTAASLAAAPLADVLTEWSGLGYNRRARFLHEAAKQVSRLPAFPVTVEALTALPGIGPNTAGAIVAYAYDEPVVYIETNIRSVFIYHFFPDEEKVSDKMIAEVVKRTLPTDLTRQWYWALMDYGSYLKKTQGNHARSSAVYTKQSTFEGSLRQVRGAVLRQLIANPLSLPELEEVIHDERLGQVLTRLQTEGLITDTDGLYQLGS